jgi:nucleoid-associated protein YgaU
LRLRGLPEAALIVAFTASIQGCGKPVLRVADASLGDYYTGKEFKKLNEEQRREYCAELARQDSAYKAELVELRAELDQTRSRSMKLRQEGDSLFAVGTAADSRIQEARKGGSHGTPPAAGRTGAATHVVRRGESLWRISAASAAYGSGAKWPSIYDANRERIHDPNLIYPGQELTIPR